jgi:hypothetical protein
LDSYPNKPLARGTCFCCHSLLPWIPSLPISFCLGKHSFWPCIPSLPVCFDFAGIPSLPLFMDTPRGPRPPTSGSYQLTIGCLFLCPACPRCKRSRALKGEAQLSLGFSCLGSFPLWILPALSEPLSSPRFLTL